MKSNEEIDYSQAVLNVMGVDMRMQDYALEYIRHEALLLRKSQGRQRRNEAYATLARAIKSTSGRVKLADKVFNRTFYEWMLRLAEKPGCAREHLRRAPGWVQQVEAKMNMLPKAVEEVSLCESRKAPGGGPLSAERVLSLAAACCRRHHALCSSAVYRELRRALRTGVTVSELHAMWVSAQVVCVRAALALSRAGDECARAERPPRATWRVADVVLLYTEPDAHRLVTDESVTLYSELQALTTLFTLVQKHRVEWSRHKAALLARAWTQLYREYVAGGKVTSLVVLQRRWHELKWQARRRLLNYWRGTGSEPPPTLLHVDIVKRFPQVVMAVLPSWSQLVAEGRVVTSPYLSGASDGEASDADAAPAPAAPGPSELMLATGQDDDVLLIEKQVETIDVDSASDSEDRLIIDEHTKLRSKDNGGQTRTNPSNTIENIGTNHVDHIANNESNTFNKETISACESFNENDSNCNREHNTLVGRINVASIESINSRALPSCSNGLNSLVTGPIMDVLQSTNIRNENLYHTNDSTFGIINANTEEATNISTIVAPNTNAVQEIDTGQTLSILNSLDPNKVTTKLIFDSDSEEDSIENQPFAVKNIIQNESSTSISQRIVFDDDETEATNVEKEFKNVKILNVTSINNGMTIATTDTIQTTGHANNESDHVTAESEPGIAIPNREIVDVTANNVTSDITANLMTGNVMTCDVSANREDVTANVTSNGETGIMVEQNTNSITINNAIGIPSTDKITTNSKTGQTVTTAANQKNKTTTTSEGSKSEAENTKALESGDVTTNGANIANTSTVCTALPNGQTSNVPVKDLAANSEVDTVVASNNDLPVSAESIIVSDVTDSKIADHETVVGINAHVSDNSNTVNCQVSNLARDNMDADNMDACTVSANNETEMDTMNNNATSGDSDANNDTSNITNSETDNITNNEAANSGTAVEIAATSELKNSVINVNSTNKNNDSTNSGTALDTNFNSEPGNAVINVNSTNKDSEPIDTETAADTASNSEPKNAVIIVESININQSPNSDTAINTAANSETENVINAISTKTNKESTNSNNAVDTAANSEPGNVAINVNSNICVEENPIETEVISTNNGVDNTGTEVSNSVANSDTTGLFIVRKSTVMSDNGGIVQDSDMIKQDSQMQVQGSGSKRKRWEGAGTGDNDGYEADAEETAVDPKLIMDTCVDLIHVTDTAFWKKYSENNQRIKIPKIDTTQLEIIRKNDQNTSNEQIETDQEIDTTAIVISDLENPSSPSAKTDVTANEEYENDDYESDISIISLSDLEFEDNDVSDESVLANTESTSVNSEENDGKSAESKRKPSGLPVFEEDLPITTLRLLKRKNVSRLKPRGSAVMDWTSDLDKMFNGEERQSEEPLQETERVAKRVQLPNIEEVRRVNSSILTAQVAPITANDGASAECADEPAPSQPEPVPTRTELLFLLHKLTTELRQRDVCARAHCCLARRHRSVNDARKRICSAAPDIRLHVHPDGVCSCCCAHLLDANAGARAAADVTQLRADIARLLGDTRASCTAMKGFQKRKARVVMKKNTQKKTELNEKPNEVLNETATPEKPAPTDALAEWERQKSLHQQYFTLSQLKKKPPEPTPAPPPTPQPLPNTLKRKTSDPEAGKRKVVIQIVRNDPAQDAETRKLVKYVPRTALPPALPFQPGKAPVVVPGTGKQVPRGAVPINSLLVTALKGPQRCYRQLVRLHRSPGQPVRPDFATVNSLLNMHCAPHTSASAEAPSGAGDETPSTSNAQVPAPCPQATSISTSSKIPTTAKSPTTQNTSATDRWHDLDTKQPVTKNIIPIRDLQTPLNNDTTASSPSKPKVLQLSGNTNYGIENHQNSTTTGIVPTASKSDSEVNFNKPKKDTPNKIYIIEKIKGSKQAGVADKKLSINASTQTPVALIVNIGQSVNNPYGLKLSQAWSMNAKQATASQKGHTLNTSLLQHDLLSNIDSNDQIIEHERTFIDKCKTDSELNKGIDIVSRIVPTINPSVNNTNLTARLPIKVVENVPSSNSFDVGQQTQQPYGFQISQPWTLDTTPAANDQPNQSLPQSSLLSTLPQEIEPNANQCTPNYHTNPVQQQQPRTLDPVILCPGMGSLTNGCTVNNDKHFLKTSNNDVTEPTGEIRSMGRGKIMPVFVSTVSKGSYPYPPERQSAVSSEGFSNNRDDIMAEGTEIVNIRVTASTSHSNTTNKTLPISRVFTQPNNLFVMNSDSDSETDDASEKDPSEALYVKASVAQYTTIDTSNDDGPLPSTVDVNQESDSSQDKSGVVKAIDIDSGVSTLARVAASTSHSNTRDNTLLVNKVFAQPNNFYVMKTNNGLKTNDASEIDFGDAHNCNIALSNDDVALPNIEDMKQEGDELQDNSSVVKDNDSGVSTVARVTSSTSLSNTRDNTLLINRVFAQPNKFHVMKTHSHSETDDALEIDSSDVPYVNASVALYHIIDISNDENLPNIVDVRQERHSQDNSSLDKAIDIDSGMSTVARATTSTAHSNTRDNTLLINRVFAQPRTFHVMKTDSDLATNDALEIDPGDAQNCNIDISNDDVDLPSTVDVKQEGDELQDNSSVVKDIDSGVSTVARVTASTSHSNTLDNNLFINRVFAQPNKCHVIKTDSDSETDEALEIDPSDGPYVSASVAQYNIIDISDDDDALPSTVDVEQESDASQDNSGIVNAIDIDSGVSTVARAIASNSHSNTRNKTLLVNRVFAKPNKFFDMNSDSDSETDDASEIDPRDSRDPSDAPNCTIDISIDDESGELQDNSDVVKAIDIGSGESEDVVDLSKDDEDRSMIVSDVLKVTRDVLY